MPVLMGDRVLMTARGLVCLQPNGDSNPEVVWTSQNSVPATARRWFIETTFTTSNWVGVLICADKNGKEIWTERLEKGKYWASPIAADGKIFVCNDEGVCTVVRAGGETAEVLAKNNLKEEIMGTPAIADGRVYIQTVTKLYCIGAKK